MTASGAAIVLVLIALLVRVVRSARLRARVIGRVDAVSHSPRRASTGTRATASEAVADGVRRVGSAGRRLARRPPDARLDRRVGAGVLVGVIAGVVVGPVVGGVLGAATWAVPWWRDRRGEVRRRARLTNEAPEIIDLFHLAVSAGLNVRLAIEAVVSHAEGIAVVALQRALDRADRGDRLADALVEIEALGEPLRPLAEALIAAERHGVPVLGPLERVAGEARILRRRRNEERARRLPVKLVFPLVCCTLPALALVTIVPVVVRSLPDLTP